MEIRMNPRWQDELDLHDSVEAVAQRVTADAKAHAPVDTGALRDSIQYELAGSGPDVSARVGSDLPYAAHVELGTSTQAPQPYLRPAATRSS